MDKNGTGNRRNISRISEDLFLAGKLAKATAAVTAIGVYNFYVNGAKAGEAVMAPFWTSYKNRVQAQTYDITGLLNEGENTVSAILGKGWALGRVACSPEKYIAESADRRPSLNACICVEYEDGRLECICTDDTWDARTSQILFSQLYDGETVDRTAPMRFLGKAVRDSEEHPEIIPQVGELVCEHERVSPCEIITTPKGETVIDFGQNLAGYVEVTVKVSAVKG